jgi:hypothetical protein
MGNLISPFPVRCKTYQLFFFAAAFFPAAGLAGRLLPNEPLKRFPLAVFLSPLPIKFFFELIK